MSSIIDIYSNIMKYKGNDVVIIIDYDNEAWFFAKQIINILEYSHDGSNAILNKFVDNINKTKYKELKNFAKYNYNIQDHAIFINEAGFYELV